jgi:hypothetical protein
MTAENANADNSDPTDRILISTSASTVSAGI